MPSGSRHTIASATIALASAGALFLYSPSASFWCATGALAGVLITPDWDLFPNVTHHYVRRYLGLPAGFCWAVITKPYSLAFKHRGVGSHSPILSTVIRLLYLGLWILPFWIFLKLPVPTLSVGICWWLLGLEFSTSTHVFMDWCDSKLGGRL